MRNPGLEPGSLAALEPESSASAIPPVPLTLVFIDNFLLLRYVLPLSSKNIKLRLRGSNWKRPFQEIRSNQNIN
jgi:hypothetical protein